MDINRRVRTHTQRWPSTYLLTVLILALGSTAFAQNQPTNDKGRLDKTELDRPELVLQTGHTSGVSAVAFSADGRILASGSADNTVKLWDPLTGSVLRSLSGHTNHITVVAFSTDGSLLASGSLDRTVKIWDVLTGRELYTFVGHSAPISSLAFSVDGRLLASGSKDKTIKLWNVATRQEVHTLAGHEQGVTTLSFGPDGRRLVSGCADNTIKLWDTVTGFEIHTLRGHSERINSVSFSPDGRLLASASSDGTINLWEPEKGHKVRVLKGHTSKVLMAVFSTDGQTLFSGSADGVIKTWNITSGTEARSTAIHADSELISVSLNPARDLLASSVGGQWIEISSTSTGRKISKLESHSSGIFATAFSPDGHWFASGNMDNSVKIWEVTTGRELNSLTDATAGYVHAVAFSPDGRLLASAGLDGKIRLWEVQLGREIRILPGHDDMVYAVAFSPDGKWLASGGGNGTVKIWEVSTGSVVRALTGHSGEVTSIAFSPNGELLLSGSTDKTIRIWDAKTGSGMQTLSGHTGAVYAVAFSPEGRRVASGGADKTVMVWEVETGREVQTLTGHSGWVNAVAFSPDGQSVVSGSDDRTIKVWEAATGRERRTLTGHSDKVDALAFSPASRWFVSGSEDGSACLWDVQSGELLATLISLRGSSDWLVVAPDGLFDGSPSAWNQILWRFRHDTFNTAPVEVFFNEYFYPGLLTDILADKRPRAQHDITLRDRRQPRLKLTLAQSATLESVSTREIKLRIEVEEAPADAVHSGGGGARDLRLFRNGVLIKAWRGDLLAGGSSRIFDVSVPVVAGGNRLSCYAFNRDDIKSNDAELIVAGAETLQRKGTLYILAIGVNEYLNNEFNLKYAMPDAEDFSAELKRQQDRLKIYDRTETMTLYNSQAKKKEILDAIASLGKKIQPEDALVIYFAGHGTIGTCRTESSQTVSAKDRFYLVPSDLGYEGEIPSQCEQAMLDQVAQHSISDEEIETAFEGMDAGKILLVIDACNSGQALESEEKRLGPMNSKGLAQLAFEKGMYILTAAQSFQEARADRKIAKGHGYLTYALVEEGLKAAAADTDPQDGQILLKEWVDYAVQQVPRMQQAEVAERRQLIKRRGEKSEVEDVQRPRVFYRREVEPQAFIIARP